MCALIGRSYHKVSCVALSMANPDLEVRPGGNAAALLAATTNPHSALLTATRTETHSLGTQVLGVNLSTSECMLWLTCYIIHSADSRLNFTDSFWMRYVRFCLFRQFQRLGAALLTNQAGAFAYDFDASGFTRMCAYLRTCLHSVIHRYVLYTFIRSQGQNRCEAKGNAVPLHAMKSCRGKEVLLHSFFPQH